MIFLNFFREGIKMEGDFNGKDKEGVKRGLWGEGGET